MDLKPFWYYYGGKFRAAPHYPLPQHDTIIEPFAGSAGYAMRHFYKKVILVEKYPVIAEMWRFLIDATRADIMGIPLTEHVDELPDYLSQGAKFLVGFCMNDATTSPRRNLSSGLRKLTAAGRKTSGWTEARRARVAEQVGYIRHWEIIEGDYTKAPDEKATWFIDAPYNNIPGSRYVHANIDYRALADWCKTKQGQVMVCENEGADWLPFAPFKTFQAGVNGKGSKEVLWYKSDGGF